LGVQVRIPGGRHPIYHGRGVLGRGAPKGDDGGKGGELIAQAVHGLDAMLLAR
jgi:GTPase involved in cell partitioning and DNA repair